MKLIECPRDAIQGIKYFIPTAAKAKYINELLAAGFDTIDFGSFVSPKAIPQMADTAQVLAMLNIGASKTKLLAIVANERGAKEACQFEEIVCLGYPFSISETFQMRNTNATIAQSVENLKVIQGLCVKNNKQLVVYISMGFGNPYGDEWNSSITFEWINELDGLGIDVISLADTVGVANPESIGYLFNQLVPAFPAIEFGVHLHTTKNTWQEKISAAWQAGCRRFDGAMLGYGGCPMAANELVGNMPTENLIEFITDLGIDPGVSKKTIDTLAISFQNLITS